LGQTRPHRAKHQAVNAVNQRSHAQREPAQQLAPHRGIQGHCPVDYRKGQDQAARGLDRNGGGRVILAREERDVAERSPRPLFVDRL
jgi:hypothetical protein